MRANFTLNLITKQVMYEYYVYLKVQPALFHGALFSDITKRLCKVLKSVQNVKCE